MYKCPHCGGETEFLPESGIIKCAYCGSEFSPESEELKKTRKKAEEHTVSSEESDAQGGKGKVYVCSQCGASLYTQEDTGVTFCSYCGSQAFLESRMRGTENLMPDVVIPFRISKEKCDAIYKEKIKSAWFLPRKMRADNTIEKFRGIYMPCWIYSGNAQAEGDYTSTTTNRSGTYDVIKTFRIKANARGDYDGFVEDASASFPDGIMREIAPFDMNKAKPFQDTYLSGFYADIGNVPADVYADKVKRSMDAKIKNDLMDERDLKRHNVTSGMVSTGTDVKATVTNVRKGFFPVWFLSNRNERTGLMSYAVVNGLTGKIHADLPVDMKKYLLLSLLIAIPIFLILQFFTMKPITLLVITMIILAILMFFGTKMIGEAYIQEHGLDDEGLRYINQKNPGMNQTGAADDTTMTSKKTRAAKSKRKTGLRVALGGICFIFIPILAAFINLVTGADVFVWGIIIGVFAFILISTGVIGRSGQNSTSADFTPDGKVKLPFPVVLRSIMFPLIGVLAGIIILIANPVHDGYYYGAVILCCLMLILTLLDFVRSNNRLSLRKPAQLGKRGGDEND